MKKLLLSTAALGFVFGLAAAQADPADHHDDRTTSTRDHKGSTDNTTQQTGPQGGQMSGPQGGRMSGPQGGNMTGPQTGHMNNGPQGGVASHHDLTDHTGGAASGGGHHDQAVTGVGVHVGGVGAGVKVDTGRGDGSGGRHGNATIIFGIGGHGYNNHANFGHSRHNSAFDSLRRAVTASHRYHSGTYRKPHGWYEHRWSYGDFLPTLFFAQQYWIEDYRDYDLPEPPDGTVWLRYGNDALLVDEDTGEIIQVVYGIFY